MQSKNVYMQICIYVKMCTCIYVNVYVYLYACVNIYVCMYVCMYGWMDGWMDGWMYGCNVYLYTLYTCMIIYVHIHVMISIP